jgi:hypothetical protein
MQRLRRADKHLEQWINVEHYRLHCAQRWPESDYKEVVLAAIHSTLKTLEATSLAPVDSPLHGLRILASSGSGAGIAFEITKPRHDHAVGGVRADFRANCNGLRPATSPHGISPFAPNASAYLTHVDRAEIRPRASHVLRAFLNTNDIVPPVDRSPGPPIGRGFVQLHETRSDSPSRTRDRENSFQPAWS